MYQIRNANLGAIKRKGKHSYNIKGKVLQSLCRLISEKEHFIYLCRFAINSQVLVCKAIIKDSFHCQNVINSKVLHVPNMNDI